MFKIERFTAQYNNLFNKAIHIREKVFIEEQDIDPEAEFDEWDKTAVHYLVFKGDLAIATARWRETNDGIKLERFATLREYRYQKIGSYLLNKILDDVKPLRRKIFLHSQAEVSSFYKKHGFVSCGDSFMEAGIEHYKMIYKSVKRK